MRGLRSTLFCLGIVRYLLFHADALEELLDNALHGKEVTLPVHAERALRQTVTIANPLGEDFSVMRTISLNGILTSLASNYNRRNKNVRLYELGNIYIPGSLPVVDYPDERMQFTLGM